MPSVSVTVPHALSDDEAARRLRQRYETIKTTYGEHLKDMEEQWSGQSLCCRFTTFGMKVQSTVTSAPGEVRVQLDLPVFALAFKAAIEERIRAELGAVLG
jgi:predicted metal-dependent hydrolase